jgi:chromosome partitioning protein
MTEVLLAKNTLNDVVQACTIPGLYVAPCNLNLVAAEVHLAGQPGKELVVREHLEGIKQNYEYAVIDTPPNMGTLTLNGLVAADTILVPIQCEYYALEGVEQLEFVVGLLGKRFGRTPTTRVLLTMYDQRTKLSQEIVRDVTRHFGERVFETIIPRNIKLAEAPANGLCIYHHAPKSPGAKAYAALGKGGCRMTAKSPRPVMTKSPFAAEAINNALFSAPHIESTPSPKPSLQEHQQQNTDISLSAMDRGFGNPRISVYSPMAASVLDYLDQTTPRGGHQNQVSRDLGAHLHPCNDRSKMGRSRQETKKNAVKKVVFSY